MFESSLKLSLRIPKWFNAFQRLKLFPFLLRVTCVMFAPHLLCFFGLQRTIFTTTTQKGTLALIWYISGYVGVAAGKEGRLRLVLINTFLL